MKFMRKKNYVVEFLFFVKNHNRAMAKCNFHIVSWILDLPLYIFLVILSTVTFNKILRLRSRFSHDVEVTRRCPVPRTSISCQTDV